MMMNEKRSPGPIRKGARSSAPQAPPGAEFSTNWRSLTRGLTCKTMSPRLFSKLISNLFHSSEEIVDQYRVTYRSPRATPWTWIWEPKLIGGEIEVSNGTFYRWYVDRRQRIRDCLTKTELNLLEFDYLFAKIFHKNHVQLYSFQS